MARWIRQVTLARYVAGAPIDASMFALNHAEEPQPAEGQVLLKPLALSIDPYLRGRLTGIDDFFLPQLAVGEPVASMGIARVVYSRRADVTAGDVVSGVVRWADLCLWDGRDALEDGGVLRQIDPLIGERSHALGVLGLNGLTAFFGVVCVAKPRPGSTMLVSAAAGGVGSVAGQIGRLMGAKVYGLAGFAHKRQMLIDQLGFQAALDYRSPSFPEQLSALLPNGPDVYFDNVGGAVSQIVMGAMRPGTRVIECGQISTYDDDDGGWRVDIRPVHANGLIWRGFACAHFKEFYPAALAQLGHWVKQERLIPVETRRHGLESAPAALEAVMRGNNVGKMVVILDDTLPSATGSHGA